jgi:Transposase DDE domain
MINLKYHQETITLMKGTTRNWSEYSAGLKNRGSLIFWVDETVLESWYNETPGCKRGASKDYSDLAIITFVTMKSVYHQAGRQTHGRKKWKRDSNYH